MTTPTPPPQTGLIPSLVGIRGLLAAIVVAVHMAPLAITLVPSAAPVWQVLWRSGYPALDVFFILSGYVVTTGYHRKFGRWPGWGTFGRFLLARLSRFYPVHLAVLAALVLAAVLGPQLGLSVPHRGTLGGDLPRALLLVHGWGGASSLTWNGPSWSLSAEWFCYLIFPLFMPLILRVRRPGAVLAGYLFACAVPLVAYTWLGFEDAMITYRAPLFRAVGGFVAGAMLWRLGHVGSRIPTVLGRFTGALFLATATVSVLLHLNGLPPLLVLPLAGLVVPALAQRRGLFDAFLSTRPMLFAGELSVPIYLTHVPWILAAGTVLTPARFPGAWGWAAIALCVLGALVVAYATLVLIERPGQVLLRRLGRPRPRASSAPHVVNAAQAT